MSHYDAWSLRWIHHIIHELKGSAPIILYAKGMGHKAPILLNTGAKVISLDWTINLRRMRQSIGHGAAVQGNLDPVVLTTTPEITRRETQRALDSAGPNPASFLTSATT